MLSWASRIPPQKITAEIPISTLGGGSLMTQPFASRVYSGYDFPLRFGMASSMTAETAASLFEEIVLRPEEDMVLDALRIIEPSIERIAPARIATDCSGSASSRRSSIFVRLKGVKDRIPIVSMGDGIGRLLGLALNVAHTENGILLIDEIDTGLHHTVMKEMWKFLYAVARTYNVQVFATTHSRDCYESLATVCRESVSDNSDVTIQRIERRS